MGLDKATENITKKLAKRAERVRVAKEFNNDMYFYYLRCEDRQIFGGVCLKKVDGVWCRGISLWSGKDKFDRNASKRQARSRLMRAIKTKQDDFPVNPEAYEPSYKLYRYYTQLFYNFLEHITAHKSKYDAKLTDTEKRTVGE